LNCSSASSFDPIWEILETLMGQRGKATRMMKKIIKVLKEKKNYE